MLLEIPVGKETAYADFLLIEGSFSYAGNIAILSDLIIPLFIVVILMSGFLNRRNAYADFVKGAKKD